MSSGRMPDGTIFSASSLHSAMRGVCGASVRTSCPRIQCRLPGGVPRSPKGEIGVQHQRPGGAAWRMLEHSRSADAACPASDTAAADQLSGPVQLGRVGGQQHRFRRWHVCGNDGGDDADSQRALRPWRSCRESLQREGSVSRQSGDSMAAHPHFSGSAAHIHGFPGCGAADDGRPDVGHCLSQFRALDLSASNHGQVDPQPASGLHQPVEVLPQGVGGIRPPRPLCNCNWFWRQRIHEGQIGQ
mmetsp:Transcript_8374/g.15260  ORF Transcript_8374/g.15260 Transcript_8374/m.15260 type:complete len:244 (-) Transcript_8374:481-1212(-)